MDYCPTDTMWSDILTKPKQGKEFFKMRSVLMGCPVDGKGEMPKSKQKKGKQRQGINCPETHNFAQNDTAEHQNHTKDPTDECVSGTFIARVCWE